MLAGDVSFPIAFISGLLSFFAPCILPMIPVYIMFLTGSISNDEINKNKFSTFIRSLGFVLGFTIIFIIIGLSATALGQVFNAHKPLLLKISGIVMMIFGLNMMGLFKLKFVKLPDIKTPNKVNGFFSSLLMGLAFGAGWTPCFGPILGSIAIYAASSETFIKGVMLLIVYALGIAVPFLLTGLFINAFDRLIKKADKFIKYVPIISGVILFIFGLLILTNQMVKLSSLF